MRMENLTKEELFAKIDEAKGLFDSIEQGEIDIRDTKVSDKCAEIIVRMEQLKGLLDPHFITTKK